MTSPTAIDYLIEPLNEQHLRTTFSCGVAALDRYLRQQAGQDVRRHFASVYLVLHRPTRAVAGFYTLANTAIQLTELPAEQAKKLPRYPQVPATLLGRLAVDSAFRGRGLGEMLLFDAMRRRLDSGRTSASFALVVEAKDEKARMFYLHYGFKPMAGSVARLFLPIQDIESDFG